MQFVPIESRKYITIDFDHLLDNNPNETINYIKEYMEYGKIDFLRLNILNPPSEAQLANLELIKKYFKHNNRLKIIIKLRWDLS